MREDDGTMDELQARRESKAEPVDDLAQRIVGELNRLGTGVQRLADEWETTKPEVSRRLRDLLAGRKP